MAGHARNGFAMDIFGQSSRSEASSGSSRPPKRPSAFHDEEEDEDDGFHNLHRNGSSSSGRQGHHKNRSSVKDELLTGYSNRGAEKLRRSPPRQGPRIIAKQADLNWMEERKRRLGLEKYKDELGRMTSMRTPGSNGNAVAQNSSDVEMKDLVRERIGDEKQLSGLQIQKKQKSREEVEMEEIERLQAEAMKANGTTLEGDETPTASQAGHSPVGPVQTEAEREDEAARLALLSGQGFGAAFQRQEERVIPISEEEALKRDTETRPEAPTLSDYAKMPVEEFGAALLRGMGWKEGMGAGKDRQGPTSAPEVKKRAALLGLGAKERAVDEKEAGARGKNFRVERPERRYIPVVKKEREKENGGHGSSNSSPAPRGISHRERSRSPKRRRDDRDQYDRRDERSHRSRSERDYSDEEYERRRRKEREKDRDRPRDHATRSHGGYGR